MRGLRYLALLPSAGGVTLCLFALSLGAPAVAAQDMATTYSVSHVGSSAPTSNQTGRSLEVEHERMLRRVALLRLRAARIERRRAEARQDARQEARAARQAAEAQAQQQAVQGNLPPAPSQPVASGGAMVMPGGFEGCVIQAESGGNPTAINPSSGASGLFGFLLSTWMNTPEGASYPGGAYTAPASVQEQAFQWVFARSGVAPWRPYDGC